MAFDKKTFQTRTLSAIIFGIIMLAGLLYNEWSFIILFTLVTALCLKEYAFLVEKILHTSFTQNEKMNFYFVGMATFFCMLTLPMQKNIHSVALFLQPYFFYTLGLVLGSVILFFIFKKNKQSIYLLTGVGYMAVSFALLVQLRFMHSTLPIALIVFIWINDSLAYLTGSFVGKTALAPSISPKKTIEGTLGGIFFTLVVAFVWAYFHTELTMLHWISIALVASLIGTIGDLVQSKLKRMANVKDSGNIMPGHGGAFDRFDSLILAAPFAYLVSLLF